MRMDCKIINSEHKHLLVELNQNVNIKGTKM